MKKKYNIYRTYGRTKGRKKIQLINETLFTKYLIDIKKDLLAKTHNILDIGSGSGESSVYLAKK